MNKVPRARSRRAIGEGEDKLRAVVEALPDLLFVLDEEGTYLDVMSSTSSSAIACTTSFRGNPRICS